MVGKNVQARTWMGISEFTNFLFKSDFKLRSVFRGEGWGSNWRNVYL